MNSGHTHISQTRAVIGKRLLGVIVASSILYMSSAFAGDDAIGRMMVLADFGRDDIVIGTTAMKSGDTATWRERRGKLLQAEKDFEAAILPALKSAKKNAALAKAIREFHDATNQLFEAGVPESSAEATRTQPLLRDFETRQKALMLELEAAGS